MLQVCSKEYRLSGFLIINQNHPQENVFKEDEIKDSSPVISGVPFLVPQDTSAEHSCVSCRATWGDSFFAVVSAADCESMTNRWNDDRSG